MRCWVVFSQMLGSRVRIDGIVAEGVGAGGEPPGWPFTFELVLPDTGWMAASLVEVLAGWAEHDVPVDIEVEGAAAGPMLSCNDGRSIVRLPLARTAV